jgi:2-(1,2-epoxy-1,2-dihydrophenyl)acetyl-CoA isomerase
VQEATPSQRGTDGFTHPAGHATLRRAEENSMAYETLTYALADGVATITLNRPERLNALNPRLVEELIAALGEAGTDLDVRAVILTGAGRGFCAGADIAGGKDSPLAGNAQKRPDPGPGMDRLFNPLIRAVRRLPKPVIGAINGVAAGGGAGLAMACDIILAARSARFDQAFVRIALVPDMGCTWFLPRLVGEGKAKALAMLGEPVMAEDAERMGMVWKVYDDATLIDEARKLALRLAAGPTNTYAAIKRAYEQSAANSLDQQLDAERDLQRRCAASEDHLEGVTAFREKRAPKFAGR